MNQISSQHTLKQPSQNAAIQGPQPFQNREVESSVTETFRRCANSISIYFEAFLESAKTFFINLFERPVETATIINQQTISPQDPDSERAFSILKNHPILTNNTSQEIQQTLIDPINNPQREHLDSTLKELALKNISENYPDLFTKISNNFPQLLNIIINKESPNAILEQLNKIQDFFDEHEPSISEYFATILKLDNLEMLERYILNVSLPLHRKAPELFSQIINEAKPQDIMYLLANHFKLVDHLKKNPELLTVILNAQNHDDMTLYDLDNSPKILLIQKFTPILCDKILALNHRTREYTLYTISKLKDNVINNENLTSELLSKIIDSQNRSAILDTLNNHTSLLNNPNLTPELWDKILTLNNPEKILNTLGKHEGLLDPNNLSSEHLNEIFKLEDPAGTLNALGKYPNLLKSDILTSIHLDKILTLKNPEKILNTLGQHKDLLNPNKLLSKSLDKIFEANDPNYTDPSIFKALVKYPNLLNLSPELLNEIFKLKDFTGTYKVTGILKALGKYPSLFDPNKLSTERLNNILKLTNPVDVLSFLGKYLYLIDSDKLESEGFDEILKSNDADARLEDLLKSPKLLKPKELR